MIGKYLIISDLVDYTTLLAFYVLSCVFSSFFQGIDIRENTFFKKPVIG